MSDFLKKHASDLVLLFTDAKRCVSFHYLEDVAESYWQPVWEMAESFTVYCNEQANNFYFLGNYNIPESLIKKMETLPKDNDVASIDFFKQVKNFKARSTTKFKEIQYTISLTNIMGAFIVNFIQTDHWKKFYVTMESNSVGKTEIKEDDETKYYPWINSIVTAIEDVDIIRDQFGCGIKPDIGWLMVAELASTKYSAYKLCGVPDMIKVSANDLVKIAGVIGTESQAIATLRWLNKMFGLISNHYISIEINVPSDYYQPISSGNPISRPINGARGSRASRPTPGTMKRNQK